MRPTVEDELNVPVFAVVSFVNTHMSLLSDLVNKPTVPPDQMKDNRGNDHINSQVERRNK